MKDSIYVLGAVKEIIKFSPYMLRAAAVKYAFSAFQQSLLKYWKIISFLALSNMHETNSRFLTSLFIQSGAISFVA